MTSQCNSDAGIQTAEQRSKRKDTKGAARYRPRPPMHSHSPLLGKGSDRQTDLVQKVRFGIHRGHTNTTGLLRNLHSPTPRSVRRVRRTSSVLGAGRPRSSTSTVVRCARTRGRVRGTGGRELWRSRAAPHRKQRSGPYADPDTNSGADTYEYAGLVGLQEAQRGRTGSAGCRVKCVKPERTEATHENFGLVGE